jgi:hypothetical protein
MAGGIVVCARQRTRYGWGLACRARGRPVAEKCRQPPPSPGPPTPPAPLPPSPVTSRFAPHDRPPAARPRHADRNSSTWSPKQCMSSSRMNGSSTTSASFTSVLATSRCVTGRAITSGSEYSFSTCNRSSRTGHRHHANIQFPRQKVGKQLARSGLPGGGVAPPDGAW